MVLYHLLKKLVELLSRMIVLKFMTLYFTVIKKHNKKVISVIYKNQLLNIKVNKAGINGGPTFFAILKCDTCSNLLVQQLR